MLYLIVVDRITTIICTLTDTWLWDGTQGCVERVSFDGAKGCVDLTLCAEKM